MAKPAHTPYYRHDFTGEELNERGRQFLAEAQESRDTEGLNPTRSEKEPPERDDTAPRDHWEEPAPTVAEREALGAAVPDGARESEEAPREPMVVDQPVAPVSDSTKAELMDRARELDIPKRSSMSKEELAQAVSEAE